jgi:hypothetical protein
VLRLVGPLGDEGKSYGYVEGSQDPKMIKGVFVRVRQKGVV